MDARTKQADRYEVEHQRRVRAHMPNELIHDRLDRINEELGALLGYTLINAAVAIGAAALLALILWRVW